MEHLIKPEEIAQYSRPMSKHIDEEMLNALIRETEDHDIKPVIGDDLFAFLVNHMDEEPTVLFLNGGRWNEVDDPTFDESFEEEPDCNKFRYFCGLKTAIAYYVQAKLIKVNDTQLTRSGLVKKDNEYSVKPYGNERNTVYNDFCSIADRYLNECRAWLNCHSYFLPAHTKFSSHIRNNRSRIKVIGQ